MIDIVALLLLAVCFIGIYVTIWFFLLFLEKEKEFHKHVDLKAFPKVSVLIPAHNEEKIISKTISSMLKIDYPRSRLEVVVIDDGSSDRTYQIAKSFAGKGVQVYRKKKGGKASALNYGLKRVRTDLILALDADCFLARDALKKMVGEMQDKWTMAAIPSIEVLNKVSILQKIQAIEYSFMNFFRKLTASIYALAIAPAAVLYKTKFLRKYGGFDENTLTEDFEIGLRIVSHNFSIAHVFDSNVFTIVPAGLGELMKQRIRWAYGSFTELSKYKRLLSIKYGDLGAFILPQIPIYAGIVIFVLILTMTSAIQDALRQLYLLELIGYDIRISLSFSFLYLFDIRSFVVIIMGLLAFLNYFLVKRTKRENINFAYFLIYVFIYSWLLVFFEFVAILYFLFRKKPRW